MTYVKPSPIPNASLLLEAKKLGAFADCYVTEIAGSVSQSAFIEAFYTTALFKVERAILRWMAHRPSTDLDAKKLADGTSSQFAAWRVEGRTAEQLLLADFTGRTKSWLMVVPVNNGAGTLLYFGSAVVPRSGVDGVASGTQRMGFVFYALLGFHRLYSKLLLRAARVRLLAKRGG